MSKTTKTFWMRFFINVDYDSNSLILKNFEVILALVTECINKIYNVTCKYSLLARKILFYLHCS